MGRFERFRFSVPAVPLGRGLLCVFSAVSQRGRFRFRLIGSWKTVPAVPVPHSVPAKTVPTVPVSGSGSVPGPPCKLFVAENGPFGTPFLAPKITSKKFIMWVPFLRPFPGDEAHKLFFWGPKIGCFGWGPKSLC